MSYQRSAKQKIAAKDRRSQDRELARIERERRARRARQKRIALIAGAAVVVCGVLVGAGFGVKAAVAAGRVGPQNMATDGLILSSDGTTFDANHSDPLPDNGTPTPMADYSSYGLTQVLAYVDFGDPASAAFWAANGETLKNFLKSSQGYGSLELHPVALTAKRSAYEAAAPTPDPSATATPTAAATPNPNDAGTDYAVRAANAFACVAANEPTKAVDVTDALFAAQATFGTEGLSEDELVALVKDAGVTKGGWEKCIRGERYVRWVAQATNRAQTGALVDAASSTASTPLVVVAGKPYTGAPEDAAAFTTLLAETAAEITAAAQQG